MINELEKILCTHANPVIAAQQAAYMRNQFPFFGLPKPLRTSITKPLLKNLTIKSETDLIALLNCLWQKEQREFHYLALEIARNHKKLWSPVILEQFDNMIRSKSWWNTVDTIASQLIGPLLKSHPELITTIDTWIEDKNMWTRRSALIFQLMYKKTTDTSRLFNCCLQTAAEPEFFIRKAIGWALRQYSKTNPLAVQNFILENRHNLSSLSLKEAQKYL
jgi:3-methyladenine DNA glycosylase AlkD